MTAVGKSNPVGAPHGIRRRQTVNIVAGHQRHMSSCDSPCLTSHAKLTRHHSDTYRAGRELTRSCSDTYRAGGELTRSYSDTYRAGEELSRSRSDTYRAGGEPTRSNSIFTLTGTKTTSRSKLGRTGSLGSSASMEEAERSVRKLSGKKRVRILDSSLTREPSLPNLSEQNLLQHDKEQDEEQLRGEQLEEGSGTTRYDTTSSTGSPSYTLATPLQHRLSLTAGHMKRSPVRRLSSRSSGQDDPLGSSQGSILINTSNFGTLMVKIDGPEKVPPIQVFRRVARLVRLLCSVCIAIRSYAIGKGLLDDYLVAVSHRRNKGADEDGDVEELTFNLKDFKIKKELEVPFSTQLLLQKRPEDRSPDDIVIIGRLMRGLPSFRKYTREMQQLFCKIVRYMKCQQNRVVLRKGHIGYNLYFIYTGSCSVVLDKGDSNVFVKKEVIMLKKGACFGEIALVQNTRRNATVICSEDTEFLVVDKDLFLDNGLNHQMEQEFHFRYSVFRSLPIMQHWTDAQVHDLSNVSRTEEFGYNKVVVKDSRHNDWLWFVIKGSCDIIRLVDLEKCPTFKQTVLGSSPEARRSLQHLAAATRGSLIKPCDDTSKQSSTWSLVSDTSQLSHRESGLANRKLENISEIDDVLNALEAGDEVETVLKVITEVEPVVDPDITTHDEEKSDIQEAGYGLFFKVDTLRDGQCFGMDTIGDLSSAATRREFVMISRGCEVIHVPKTRFMDIADTQTLTGAAKLCKTYPSDDALCARFIARCQWDSYKREVVQDVITHKSRCGFETGLRGSGAEHIEEDTTQDQDRAGAQEMREMVLGRTVSTVPQSSTARHRTVRPHTAFGTRSKGSTQKAMRASWEMDLDMMTSMSNSRHGSRGDRPRTCPAGGASSRREALLASYTRGSHQNASRTPSHQGEPRRTPNTSKTLKTGTKINTGLIPNTGKSTLLTPRRYQVEGTNVFVKGSQRTLQIISNLRSRSHEDRLHKIRNK